MRGGGPHRYRLEACRRYPIAFCQPNRPGTSDSLNPEKADAAGCAGWLGLGWQSAPKPIAGCHLMIPRAVRQTHKNWTNFRRKLRKGAPRSLAFHLAMRVSVNLDQSLIAWNA